MGFEIEWLIIIVMCIVNIVAIGVGWGRIGKTVRENTRRIKQLENDLDSRLCDDQGLPIYETIRGAEQMETRILRQTCEKIDTLRKTIDDYHEDVNNNRREINENIRKLFELVSKKQNVGK